MACSCCSASAGAFSKSPRSRLCVTVLFADKRSLQTCVKVCFFEYSFILTVCCLCCAVPGRVSTSPFDASEFWTGCCLQFFLGVPILFCGCCECARDRVRARCGIYIGALFGFPLGAGLFVFLVGLVNMNCDDSFHLYRGDCDYWQNWFWFGIVMMGGGMLAGFTGCCCFSHYSQPYCFKCGATVNSRSRFCAVCAVSLVRSVPNCPKCSLVNKAGSVHCAKCGNQLPTLDPEDEALASRESMHTPLLEIESDTESLGGRDIRDRDRELDREADEPQRPIPSKGKRGERHDSDDQPAVSMQKPAATIPRSASESAGSSTVRCFEFGLVLIVFVSAPVSVSDAGARCCASSWPRSAIAVEKVSAASRF